MVNRNSRCPLKEEETPRQKLKTLEILDYNAFKNTNYQSQLYLSWELDNNGYGLAYECLRLNVRNL